MTESTSSPSLLADAQAAYAELSAQGLKLNITRGKPAADQLELSMAMLSMPGEAFTAADGTDGRNYGGLDGLVELRAIFAGAVGVPTEQLLAMGNSSLELMHATVSTAVLTGVPGGDGPWFGQDVKVLCPVPGYDRHFSLTDALGLTMIPVAMDEHGPDMDQVEALVAADPSIKAIWCVPKYSNPTGVTYSDEVVGRLASMPTAAGDFRILWDNAYAVHHLTETRVEVADVLALAAEAGNADRPLIFGSTSKITFAGAGVAFWGASPANVAWFLAAASNRTIGPDKLNQLRHVQFLGDEAGLAAHMDRHRALIAPKFAAVARILEAELGGTGLAEWTDPIGGYFVTLTLTTASAQAVVAAAADAGIVLTPAGATHPYGDDPDDAVIRIAPTFVTLAELEAAIAGLATCVKLVGYAADA